VTPLGTEDYYGFSLDGDGRFLLGDFTVTHNTGKTVSFLEQANRVRSHGGRTLILAHRDELIQQPRRKLEALGIVPDIEKGKQRASLNAKIVIASVQSLRGARLQRFARDHFALVIVDECHHSTSQSYRAILDHFADAKVLGVTATPDRADGQALGDIFETVAFRYEIRQAIREQWLVPIVARRVVVDSVDLSGVATRAGDLAQDQLAEVMETERAIRGVVDPLLELAGTRQTVVFGVDVAHARLLSQRLNDERPGCARWVSGETDETQRTQMLEEFERGEFQFLCNCQLLLEGWDCQRASCVAMVRPTKSRALFVQAVGRVLRILGLSLAESIANGKRDALLLDFTGSAGRHRLVGPIDCLAGSEQGLDAFGDDLRAELDRLLGTQQCDLEEALARAGESAEARRAALALEAVVTFHAEQIDPFIGWATPNAQPQINIGWTDKPPSEAQIKSLDGYGVTVTKLPPSFSAADATRLCIRLRQRIDSGLCSLRQARKLHAAGIRGTSTLPFKRAKELVTKLREAGWSRPWVIWGEPEAQTEASVAAIAEIRRHIEERRADRRESPRTVVAGLDHESLP